MGVLLKIYATIIILLWMAGLVCWLFGKLESKAYDIIATAMGMVIGFGFIGIIAFAVWSLWNL
jgi:hypothetical protein